MSWRESLFDVLNKPRHGATDIQPCAPIPNQTQPRSSISASTGTNIHATLRDPNCSIDLDSERLNACLEESLFSTAFQPLQECENFAFLEEPLEIANSQCQGHASDIVKAGQNINEKQEEMIIKLLNLERSTRPPTRLECVYGMVSMPAHTTTSYWQSAPARNVDDDADDLIREYMRVFDELDAAPATRDPTPSASSSQSTSEPDTTMPARRVDKGKGREVCIPWEARYEAGDFEDFYEEEAGSGSENDEDEVGTENAHEPHGSSYVAQYNQAAPSLPIASGSLGHLRAPSESSTDGSQADTQACSSLKRKRDARWEDGDDGDEFQPGPSKRPHKKDGDDDLDDENLHPGWKFVRAHRKKPCSLRRFPGLPDKWCCHFCPVQLKTCGAMGRHVGSHLPPTFFCKPNGCPCGSDFECTRGSSLTRHMSTNIQERIAILTMRWKSGLMEVGWDHGKDMKELEKLKRLMDDLKPKKKAWL